MITLNIFEYPTDVNPIKTLKFNTIAKARDVMNNLDCYDFPAEVSSDRFICRNFPNPYAISGVQEKMEVMNLYYARDDKWRKVYSPSY